MQKRMIQVGLQGMNQDIINPAVNTKQAYEIKNFRINATGHSNGIELTSERGTKLVLIAYNEDLYDDIENAIYEGYPERSQLISIIGHCVLNNYLVLFVHGVMEQNELCDAIVRLELTETSDGPIFLYKRLYVGHLDFDEDHRIECISCYENDAVQKIYWIDGKNYPRVINIARTYKDQNNNDVIGYGDFSIDEDPFSFYQKVDGLYSEIKVKKSYVGGLFYAGVIQYAFSFYNLNSQETPIIYTTPLNYVSHSDRGEEPNKQLGCAFDITVRINEIDRNNFDYLRVYSIYRTSLNGTPQVKVIKDIKCSTLKYAQTSPIYIDLYEALFTDTNEQGYDFDAYRILVNSDHIRPNAISFKDLKMFLGNYSSDFEIQNPLDYYSENNVNWTLSDDKVVRVKQDDIAFYRYNNQTQYNSDNIKTFKFREKYKLGFQLQDKYGNWGQVFLYSDNENDKHPERVHISGALYDDTRYKLPYAVSKQTISQIFGNEDLSEYVNIRPVVSYPTLSERSILCQGIINPTVFNAGQRHAGTCYALSSWFFRPFNPEYSYISNNGQYAGFVENRHNYPLLNSTTEQGEVLCMYFDGDANKKYYYKTTWCDDVTTFKNGDGVDPSSPFSEHGPFGMEAPRLLKLVSPGNITITTLGGDEKTVYVEYVTYESPTRFVEYTETVINSSNPKVCEYELTIYNTEQSGSGYVEIAGPDIVTVYFAEDDYEYVDSSVQSKRPYKSYDLFENDDFDKYGSFYYVDQLVVTLNSPELQFDDNIKNVDLSQYKIRKVGLVSFSELAAKYNIIAESPLFLNTGTVDEGNTSNGLKHIRSSLLAKGFYDRTINYYNDNARGYGHTLSNGLFWLDDINNIFTWDGYVDCGWNNKNALYFYAVYPWLRQHLNNWVGNKYEPIDTQSNGSKAGVTEDSESSKIIKKVLSNLKYCETRYFNYDDTSSVGLPSKTIKMFSSDQNIATRIDNSELYCGNADQLITCNSEYIGTKFKCQKSSSNILWEDDYEKNGYPIVIGRYPYYGKPDAGQEEAGYNNIDGWISTFWFSETGRHNFVPMNSGSGTYKNYTPSDNTTDPIMIRYKSAPHIVCKLGDETNPDFKIEPLNPLNGQGYLYIGEIYKEHTLSDNDKFSLLSRTWIPCGEALSLYDNNGNLSNKYLKWTEGDTYFQRYDCLKTYPYSNEDYQSVVEIASFMVETHINLDGRYDQNRGLVDNTFVNPTNFNLINDVYSQHNNFFQYNILDDERFKTNNFPTMVTWSLNKINNQEIDEWTRTNTAAFMDLDGDKGSLTALRRFNNQIYAFQESGISRIKYNENVAIPTSNGTPIELGNSATVNGKDYLSETIGSQNKWSCISTQNGIFFVDNNTPGIYRLGGGEQILTNLTKNNLLRWFESNNKEGFINTASYDANMNEILFTYGDEFNEESLTYNNDYKVFSAFYDYKGVVGNIRNHSFNIVGNNIHFLREGKPYNYFYGLRKPYWVSFVANSNIDGYSPSNAIYDNVWYKADVLHSTKTENFNYDELIEDRIETIPDFENNRGWYETFNKIVVGNDYQYAENRNQTKNFDFIKKFRTWRVPVPRQDRTRMRNSWLRVRLENTKPSYDKMVLRDIYVDAFY